MVNIKEVAKQAGVSASTVSRVLTGNIPVAAETRQKVLDAVKDMNYQPNPLAQGLKGTRIKAIGLFIPNVRDLVFPAAVRGIEDTAKQHGYTVVLCNTDESIEKELSYIQNLRRRLINGFILSTARSNSPHLLALKEEKFPMVCLIRHLGEELDAVVLDNRDGAYQAVKYLVQRGHRKIVILNGNMEVYLYRERFAGYRQALEEAGIPLDKRLIFDNINGWDESGRVVRDMLNSGVRPDAIFGTSDPKAIGVLKAVKDCGFRVPDDISVIGFDDSDIAAFLDPPLTTVAQPFYEMGVKACEKLIRLIESKRRSRPKVEVLPARLVVRDSVR
ncbi:LacI family transcriptional regulator [Anaerosporomusa subterranea]|uniref:LacI family transcriptional regulator n=1 Tax=Anaerosporomusa subterranea TaxID=1794912 RepID=A0A154BTW1_ANASB|nr:LacI family DNA-binding transcriptional regulator [Anaerosporomusa subterranea]KYZ76958.1 LacI family transcriptional regulator [Anaerosporomusa subterranea]